MSNTHSNGLQITHREVLEQELRQNLGPGLGIIKKQIFLGTRRNTAATLFPISKPFGPWRAGFASGNFVYGLIVARAPSNHRDSNGWRVAHP